MELALTPDRLTLDHRPFPWDAEAALGELPGRAADRLRAPVRRAGLRLAVLSSCLTGAELLAPRQPGDDPQRVPGVARVLLEAGVPLALAMQYPMLVEAGRRFTAALYRDLARGRSVNEAVALARRRLSAEAGQPGVVP